MKKKEYEPKSNYLNYSMQLPRKIFNSNLVITDYNICNENDNNNKMIKLNRSNKLCKNLNKSTNMIEKNNNRIVVNSNYSKVHPNMIVKSIYPDYIMKTPGLVKSNKSILEKKIYRQKNKKNNNEKILNNSANSKNIIIQYSSHPKEMKDFNCKIKIMKKSNSKGNHLIKKKRNNRNLNLTLSDFSSVATDIKKKDNSNINCKIRNINKSPEIVMKKKFINTTKNKLNNNIFGKIKLNDINCNLKINNSNISINNKNNKNINISNKNTFTRKNVNSAKFSQNRKVNKKINMSSSYNIYECSTYKNTRKYSSNKKYEKIKNTMNEQINDINLNNNKNSYISDSESIKKNELIFETIQNSFFKIISLMENKKQKEVSFDIFQKFNQFFKKNNSIVNAIIKKNEDLNEKNKKYKEINRNIEKENASLIDKCELLQKKIEEIENKIINQNSKEHITNTESNKSNNGNLNNEESDDTEEDESSVNTEELESIRFFDKIIMKKHSFSKANIPELEIDQIKLDDESEKKENEKVNHAKIKYNIKNKNNIGKYFKDNKQKYYKYKDNKKYNRLSNINKKNHKVIGYSKIAEDKKKIDKKNPKK